MTHLRRVALAARLRAVRAAASPSGNQFARDIGWHQSRVSKLETGTQFPTEDDIHAWVRAARADDDVKAELLGLLAEARIEYVTNRDAARRDSGLAQAHAELAALEKRATRIAEWQPAMVPGIVQTSAYARELLLRPHRPSMAGVSEAEIEALVAERMKRQDILYQPGRRNQIVLGEAALHSAPGTIETLLGQLDRLVSVAMLPTVEFGVVAFPAMPVLPLSGFTLHDVDAVLVETLTAESRLGEPDEVAVYAKAFDLLRDAAATGPDAVALIQRVATHLRSHNM